MGHPFKAALELASTSVHRPMKAVSLVRARSWPVDQGLVAAARTVGQSRFF